MGQWCQGGVGSTVGSVHSDLSRIICFLGIIVYTSPFNVTDSCKRNNQRTNDTDRLRGGLSP